MQLTQYDRDFYAQNIEPWLPPQLWDCHVHLYRREFDADEHKNPAEWMYTVARENTEQQLLDVYESCFPGRPVQATAFGMPAPMVDIAASNRYVTEVCARQGWQKLALVHPAMGREELETVTAGFSGIKVYLSYAPAYIPKNEIRIFDFLTHEMLRLADERGLVVMLHIPRAARLRDEVNLAQMLEIEQRYPRVKLIIAHVGRAYCEEDLGDAFRRLGQTKRMMFDISANTSRPVFEALLAAVAPHRILFGTDLPILAMRAGRITENGTYYNLVPKGAYGSLAGVPNMREAGDASRLTLLMYEGMAAFLAACRACGLAEADIHRIFYGNAAALWGPAVSPQ